LVLILLFFVDKGYYRTFYTQTEARVVFSETKAVGPGGSFGVPMLVNEITVMYVTEDGVTYTSKLRVSPKDGVREGSLVSIMYKNSNPRKCFLD
jgi:hypothetical protein